MAEHAAPGPAETGAPMDYDEHARTYSGFVAFTALAVVLTINILITLVIFGFGSGSSAFWIGTLMLLLAIAAAVIGMFTNGSWKPSAAVLVLIVLVAILTVA